MKKIYFAGIAFGIALLVSFLLQVGFSQDQITATWNLQPGWNMISTPLQEGIQPADFQNLCQEIPTFWRWDKISNDWKNDSGIAPGEGYFINLNKACSFSKSGTRSAAINKIGVEPGWNLISAIGSIDNIIGTCRGKIDTNAINHWNGRSYESVKQLEGTKGYWVYATEPCSLIYSKLTGPLATAEAVLYIGDSITVDNSIISLKAVSDTSALIDVGGTVQNIEEGQTVNINSLKVRLDNVNNNPGTTEDHVQINILEVKSTPPGDGIWRCLEPAPNYRITGDLKCTRWDNLRFLYNGVADGSSVYSHNPVFERDTPIVVYYPFMPSWFDVKLIGAAQQHTKSGVQDIVIGFRKDSNGDGIFETEAGSINYLATKLSPYDAVFIAHTIPHPKQRVLIYPGSKDGPVIEIDALADKFAKVV